jgi:hypothetical protein
MWFLDVNELNPGGRDLFQHLLPSLLEEYKFRTYPKPSDDLSQGMKFVNGQFVKEDGTVLVVNAAIYTDAVAADTFSSTKDSEDFLHMVLGDLPDLGFAYEPGMVTRKAYVSQVTVRCCGQLRALNSRLTEFSKRVSSAVGGTPFDLAAIELWPDQTQIFKPANFSFQRKAGDPPSGDRYWSQAALATDRHLELLEDLEAILSE